jgi:predicted MPP superfamily phosphohydrolase
MISHHAPIDELLASLNTQAQTGLAPEQVAAKSEQFGPNKLKEKKKKSLAARFFDQFKDVMIIILLLAAVVSFVVVCIEAPTHGWGEIFEPLLIVLIVILNAVMGVYQEGKAEKALDALKNMSAPHARVIRGGEEKIIDASLLVPGDISDRYRQEYENGVAFLTEAAKRMPTFFALGNHEARQEKYSKLRTALSQTGAEILVNRHVQFGEVFIGGWYDPDVVKEPERLSALEREDGARILLCHKPEVYMKRIRHRDFDLVVSGQAAHFFGHLPGGLTADACVDLIENKGVYFIPAGKYGL